MEDKEKVDISTRYFAEEEVRVDENPYIAYYKALSSVFDFSKIDSFCDVGCATGLLQFNVKKNNPQIDVCGFEFFQYHKDAANQQIKNTINIVDLREPLNHNKKYSLVNCTEIGEHIDKNCCVQFLNNLKNITDKFLVMSWSDSGGENDHANDPHHQHLNPLKYDEFVAMMEQNGFVLLEEQTKDLLKATYIPNFHDWWRKSLTIWKVKK
jgi:hypothetical protein